MRFRRRGQTPITAVSESPLSSKDTYYSKNVYVGRGYTEKKNSLFIRSKKVYKAKFVLISTLFLPDVKEELIEAFHLIDANLSYR